MTRRARFEATLCALGLAVCLVAARPPQLVGDGGEYLVYALNFTSFHGPSLRSRDLDSLKQQVIDYAPGLDEENFYRNAVTGAGGTRDFMHFWFFSLMAAPFVGVVQAAGLPPVYGFVALNLTLFLAAFWLALPRLGAAVSALLFASPVIWWLDKAHTEVSTFSLLTIAALLARERPWWAMVAAGVASTQYPHVAVLVPLIAAVALLFNRAWMTNRRFIGGLAAGMLIAVLHPAYYYVRHGTPSLLLTVANQGTPGWAELSAIVLDPVIGLIPNFPMLAIVVIGALAVLGRRRSRELLSADVIVAAAFALFLLWVFGVKDNVHHGATPSLSRYALWFIPLAMPLLRIERLDGPGWRRFAWSAALVSAAVCVFAFHPSVPQNAREPTWPAQYLWGRHPGWHNPLPEVFTETYRETEAPLAPTATFNCEKVLLGGIGRTGTWPLPCFPADVPAGCRSPGGWCYANRVDARYTFVRAPGRWNRDAVMDEDAVWPAEAEPAVRRVLRDAGWPNLRHEPAVPPRMRSRSVRVELLEGADRWLLVIDKAEADALISLTLRGAARGELLDGMTGQPLQALEFHGAAGESWDIAIPQSPGLLLLAISRSP